MTIIDAIKNRYSVRNYEKDKLSDDNKNYIKNLLESSGRGPFGNNAKFTLIEKSDVKENEKIKLGTYGFIINPQYFIAGTIEKFEFSEVDYGYLLEKIILDLTLKGLGTCWVGGTFKRKDYFKLLDTKNNEIIPAVTPVGIPSKKKALRDKLGIQFSNKGKRYLFEALFFENNIGNSLIYDEENHYMKALEMVRLAPSAVNRQPWRIIKVNEKFHFFINRNNLINFNKSVDLQKVDIGIAMAHFQLTLNHFGEKGIWHIKNPDICDLEYIITWIAE